MTAIWRSDGATWRLLAPAGFPDEAALHSLVEAAPQMLPLAGAPQLVVLGREVRLGNGYADLVAVEPTGRLVVIEVKLARNAEARRAVVAQILTYAAYLRGLEPSTLETEVLGDHLYRRGYETISAAMAANDQAGSFDDSGFAEGLTECLVQGRFRLILVLDEAPEELIRLVGYLEAVSDKLLIDLITVSAYEIDGSNILVPQRIDAEQQRVTTPVERVARKAQGRLVEGAGDFAASIHDAPEQERAALQQLCEWAISLEAQGLVKLSTYHGITKRLTLLPRLRTDNVGLVTIWNENGGYLQFWRSVFERRAPASLPRVEALIAPTPVGQGTVTHIITSELLDALTSAYREAATGQA